MRREPTVPRSIVEGLLEEHAHVEARLAQLHRERKALEAALDKADKRDAPEVRPVVETPEELRVRTEGKDLRRTTREMVKRRMGEGQREVSALRERRTDLLRRLRAAGLGADEFVPYGAHGGVSTGLYCRLVETGDELELRSIDAAVAQDARAGETAEDLEALAASVRGYREAGIVGRCGFWMENAEPQAPVLALVVAACVAVSGYGAGWVVEGNFGGTLAEVVAATGSLVATAGLIAVVVLLPVAAMAVAGLGGLNSRARGPASRVARLARSHREGHL